VIDVDMKHPCDAYSGPVSGGLSLVQKMQHLVLLLLRFVSDFGRLRFSIEMSNVQGRSLANNAKA
jgi:hypothetical protein